MLLTPALIDIIGLMYADGPQAVELNHRLSTHQAGFTLFAPENGCDGTLFSSFFCVCVRVCS